ncbi:AMP-binding protein [Tistrella sp. BH-R2-4]|uniref:AMP-binding protein n=1 Tax=Tistrella arctica TaxID=3133430 RepID=A0ABU9YG86_9PROT
MTGDVLNQTGPAPLPLHPFHGAADIAAIERRPIEDYLTGRTVTAMLAHAAGRFAGRTAMRYLEAPADLSRPPVDIGYADLFERVMRASALFQSLGVGRDGVVATLLSGLPQTLEIAWGAADAGIAMPVNPFLDPGIIGAMLARAGAAVLCIEGPSGHDGTWEKLPAILAAAPCIRHVLVVGEDAGPVGGDAAGGLARHYEPLRDAMRPAAVNRSGAPAPDDIAAYFHTGGTTGQPKIARLTHHNIACMCVIAGFGAGLRAGDVVANGMPLFHVGGLMMGGFTPVAHGCTIVQMGRRGYRDPAVMAGLWAIVGATRPDVMIGPPTVVAAATQTFDGLAGATGVRGWISSASALPVEVQRRFTARTGIPIRQAWGLTEATLVLTYMPASGDPVPGLVGLCMPWCTLKAVRLTPDGRIAQEMPAGQPGTIIARSPALFAGYLDPAANAGVLLPDGWLNTGDIGLIDADGFVAITGRDKDIIIRGGHNIDPVMIEEPLNAHPDVALGAAVGQPDGRVGEVPVAFVMLKVGVDRDPAALLREVSALIPERAAIPRWIRILPRLPMTAVGKVHKPTLRREAARLAAAALLAIPEERITADEGEGGRIRIGLPLNAQAQAFAEARDLLAELGLDAVADLPANAVTAILDIDHLMVRAGDAVAAGDGFARLGFTVTARSDMPGLCNRLICFDALIDGACNYIEIMELTDPAKAPPPMPRVLDAPDGPVSTVMSTTDADQTARHLQALGMRLPPPLGITRDWPIGGGEVISPSFRVVIPEPEQAPFYWNACQHLTPWHYIRPEVISHPNHARQMVAVIASAADPLAAAAVYGAPWTARIEGTDPVSVRVGGPAAGGHVALVIYSPRALADAFPGVSVAPGPDRLIGFVVSTDDIEASFIWLAAAGAAPERGERGLVVRPEHAQGCLMIFEAIDD